MADNDSYRFQTTQWTQVLESRGTGRESRMALADLCAQYYRPVEFFVERWVGQLNANSRNPAALEAKDLTHSFFAKLLEGDQLQQIDQSKGRFRSYLLGAVKHFLLDELASVKAMKRGGDRVHISFADVSSDMLSTETPEARGVSAASFPSDAFFDRNWALQVVDRAVEGLRTEYVGKAASELDKRRFELLQRSLVCPPGIQEADEALSKAQWNDGAFRVALHRCRKRFRDEIVSIVKSTLVDPMEVNNEIDYLIAALAYCSPVDDAQ